MNDSSKKEARLANGIKDFTETIIGLIITGSFLLSIGHLIVQIHSWIRTAQWQPITFHQSLVNIGLLDPYFYFNLPHMLGIEKILNWFLFLSAPLMYFMLGVGVLAVTITNHAQGEKLQG